MSNVDIANIPILFSANTSDNPDKMPVKEKSSTPSMRNARQPSSLFKVFCGASFVRHTSEISSSVLPKKTKPRVKFYLRKIFDFANGEITVNFLNIHINPSCKIGVDFTALIFLLCAY